MSIAAFVIPRAALAITCSLEVKTIEGQYALADSIFVARVDSARIIEESGDDLKTEATYQIFELFKGDPPSSGKIQSNGSMNRIHFTIGYTYIFFVSQDGLVGYCGGSRRLDWYKALDLKSDLVASERKLIEEVRSLSQPSD